MHPAPASDDDDAGCAVHMQSGRHSRLLACAIGSLALAVEAAKSAFFPETETEYRQLAKYRIVCASLFRI